MESNTGDFDKEHDAAPVESGDAVNMPNVEEQEEAATLLMDQIGATRSLFLEACRMLGNLCEQGRMFHAAAVLWSMGHLPVDEVTRRLLPERGAATRAIGSPLSLRLFVVWELRVIQGKV